MAEYGIGCCLWDEEGGSGLDRWGFPKELCDRAEAWLRNYFEDGKSRVGQTREQYNQEGRAIAGEVKRILGPAYTVKYRFISPRRDSQGELQWETVSIE